ncbi:MAG: hypothetical protein NTW86_00505, partial [Candidatus Sumerlaeota bacterium]|nr:hypothetical protein [Candidatus Sumerlaeota bacterium]
MVRPLEEYPEVRAPRTTAETQRRNVAALNRMIDMAHERGLNFTLGIWDHIPRGDGDNEEPTGVTGENLIPYTRAALAKFLELVPRLDALQFRMHGESGLTREQIPLFWKSVFQVIQATRPGLRVDARAKGLPDSVIDDALEQGVNLRICTKYWMEQMGLPFHPTHIHPKNQRDRRHGYADLLRYPKRYAMHWRLWNGGTTRVLLWGDPEYVRRFVQSTHLYDGQGFEVNEPLATKMAMHVDSAPFDLLKADYQYYDYEFERYWHFYQVWGRLGYNPDTPADVWEEEFERRFGREAGPFVERALHRASWILPRIVAYNYPYGMFPTLNGWVEKQRMGDLAEYAEALPSDTEQFLSMDEAARIRLEGGDSAKIHPLQSRAWFDRAADDVLSLLGQAEARIGARRSKEFDSTRVDLMILAGLARYHARRAEAGFAYALFKRSSDLNALDDALDFEARAVDAWRTIVDAADDVYADNLMFGKSGAVDGHWRDEWAALQKGLEKLRAAREKAQPAAADGPAIFHVPTRKAAPGGAFVLRATIASKAPVSMARVDYVAGQGQGRTAEMTPDGPARYRATLPAAAVEEGLEYRIVVEDAAGRQTVFPPDPPVGTASRIAVCVTTDDAPPTVRHEPIRSARPLQPLSIAANIADASGVRWARVRYRSVTQFEDYKTAAMTPSGPGHLYTATIPAEDLPP